MKQIGDTLFCFGFYSSNGYREEIDTTVWVIYDSPASTEDIDSTLISTYVYNSTYEHIYLTYSNFYMDENGMSYTGANGSLYYEHYDNNVLSFSKKLVERLYNHFPDYVSAEPRSVTIVKNDMFGNIIK